MPRINDCPQTIFAASSRGANVGMKIGAVAFFLVGTVLTIYARILSSNSKKEDKIFKEIQVSNREFMKRYDIKDEFEVNKTMFLILLDILSTLIYAIDGAIKGAGLGAVGGVFISKFFDQRPSLPALALEQKQVEADTVIPR